MSYMKQHYIELQEDLSFEMFGTHEYLDLDPDEQAAVDEAVQERANDRFAAQIDAARDRIKYQGV